MEDSWDEEGSDIKLEEETIEFDDESKDHFQNQESSAKTNSTDTKNNLQDLQGNAESKSGSETALRKFSAFILPKTELVPSSNVDVYKRQQVLLSCLKFLC